MIPLLDGTLDDQAQPQNVENTQLKPQGPNESASMHEALDANAPGKC